MQNSRPQILFRMTQNELLGWWSVRSTVFREDTYAKCLTSCRRYYLSLFFVVCKFDDSKPATWRLSFEIVDVANRYLKMTKLHFFLLGVHSLYLDAFFNKRPSHQTLQEWILLVGVLRSLILGHFLNTGTNELRICQKTFLHLISVR